MIDRLTKPSKPKFETWYDEEIQFGISIGEYCKECQEEIPQSQGGYEGKPRLCLICKISEDRNDKLNQLEI